MMSLSLLLLIELLLLGLHLPLSILRHLLPPLLLLVILILVKAVVVRPTGRGIAVIVRRMVDIKL